jgi:serine/threonine protein kinase
VAWQTLINPRKFKISNLVIYYLSVMYLMATNARKPGFWKADPGLPTQRLSYLYKIIAVSMLMVVYGLVSSLPKVALDVLDGMLTLDPSKRLSAKAVLDSPWLKDLNPDRIPPPK